MRFEVDLYFEKNDDCVFIEHIKTKHIVIAKKAYNYLSNLLSDTANAIGKTLTLQLLYFESDDTEHVIEKKICEVQP